MTDPALRIISFLGFFGMIGIAWLFSSDRKKVPWRVVGWGIGLQFGLALLLLRTDLGDAFFSAINVLVDRLIFYTEAGSRFVFGALVETGFSFALNVLPVIIFMGSLIAVLYHVGVLQRVVNLLAWILSRTMRVSGAEALAAAANVVVGMVESTLVIKPYLPRMTRSELFSLMTLGMATVSGSVLIIYAQILGGAEYAGHLVIASLLSAPAGLLIAKIMMPETGVPETAEGADAWHERESNSVIDAAASGAINGLKLAAYIGGLLIAFYALIAMANDILGFAGGFVGYPELSFQGVLGFIMTPFALAMGIPFEDANTVGGLLGTKTILNEFVAYAQLGDLVKQDALQKRSVVIASYALCGFANFGSLAIMLGGIEGIAPERRGQVAELGLRSILSGSLTTFMTACIAGMLL
jgi:CNT family concentrative nucleoside transporter